MRHSAAALVELLSFQSMAVERAIAIERSVILKPKNHSVQVYCHPCVGKLIISPPSMDKAHSDGTVQ